MPGDKFKPDDYAPVAPSAARRRRSRALSNGAVAPDYAPVRPSRYAREGNGEPPRAEESNAVPSNLSVTRQALRHGVSAPAHNDAQPLNGVKNAEQSPDNDALAGKLWARHAAGNRDKVAHLAAWEDKQSPLGRDKEWVPQPTAEEVARMSPVQQKAQELRAALLKRGHFLTFIGLFAFTLVLYARPSEFWDNAIVNSLALYTGAFAIAVFLPTQIMTDGKPTILPREVSAVLLLCLMGFLSVPLAKVDRGYAWDTFSENFIRGIVMCVVMINVIRTEKRITWLLLPVLGVALYLAYYAVYDYATGNLVVEGYRPRGRIQGMFGNPNDMGGFFVGMMPIMVAFGIITRKLWLRLLCWSGALLLMFGVIITFSRGASLALMVNLFILAWKIFWRHRAKVVPVVLVGFLGLLVVAPGQYRTRLLSIYDNDLEVARGSAEHRSELLKESIKSSLRYPILGIGMGNFRLIHKLVTHNAYTQVSSEMGLIAFAAYLYFIIMPRRRLKEVELATREDEEQRYIYYMSVGLQASLWGFMVSSFFGAVSYYFHTYYLVGFAVTLRMIYYAKNNIPVEQNGLSETTLNTLKERWNKVLLARKVRLPQT